MDNQIKQTFLVNKRTIGLVQSGFVTLVAGEITEAGHSLRSTPATPADRDFEEVLENALGSIASDPETYARMWNALSKDWVEHVKYLGFDEKGINPLVRQKSDTLSQANPAKSADPISEKPKSINNMSTDEFVEHYKRAEEFRRGLDKLKGALGL